MRSVSLRHVTAAACVVLGSILLQACGGQSEQELLASAKTLLQKDDTNAAVIQLKTVLQKNAQSAEARFLLGQVLLKSNPTLALVELQKARDLKYSADAVTPPLARAMYATGNAKKVIEAFAQTKLSDAKAASDLKTTVALAHRAMGQPDLEQLAISSALELNPKNSTARLLRADALGRKLSTDDALALVEQVITDEPKLRDAWQLKGELLIGGKGDLEGGFKAFREALAVDPRYLPAHQTLLALAQRKGDSAAFKAQVAELKQALPNHPETRYHEAQLFLAESNVKGARERVQELVRTNPNNARYLLLAGAIELRGNSLAQAETYLGQAVQLNPGGAAGRHQLAQTYLRSGQVNKVLPVLEPLLKTPRPSASTLALAAQAHLVLGDSAKSESLFNRAAAADPADPQVQTALALIQINKGNAKAGFLKLESLAAKDPGTATDLALVSARLRRNELDAVLAALDRYQAKAPNDPLSYFLRGRILGQRKDAAAARANFEKALSADPVYFPAVAALASIDMSEKKPEQARKRIEDLLAREPKNYEALMALIDLRRRAGATLADVANLLSDAVRLNPAEATPRLLLIALRMEQRDPKAAQTAAQEAAAALPDNLQIADALGRAQLEAGEPQQAITAFTRVAAAQPKRTEPLLNLAEAHRQAKDPKSAAVVLRRALEITPNLVAAQRGLIQLSIAERRFDDAVRQAQEIQKQRPNEPVGFMVESEVRAAQKRWEPAIAAMRAALARGRGTDTAIFLHVLYGAAGRPAEAESFAAEWERENPRDGAFQVHLGSAAIGRGDHAGAEARFRKAVAMRSDDALAYNNLAWVLVVQGKPGAVAAAQRATELQPDVPAIMDTLATALAADGQLPQAIDWQRKTVAKEPGSANYRLGLAKLLVKSGDKAAARTELEVLSKLGDKFPGQAEVASLMKSL